jgi:hypothetical protein
MILALKVSAAFFASNLMYNQLGLGPWLTHF